MQFHTLSIRKETDVAAKTNIVSVWSTLLSKETLEPNQTNVLFVQIGNALLKYLLYQQKWIICFIEFSSAFDSIKHVALWQIMQAYDLL